MKILLVTHDFLPRHRAGVEICAFWLARALRERGQDARVFTTDKDLARPEGALRRREVEGVPVWEMVRNRMFRSLRETWDFPPAGRAFRRVLAEWRPEVVHFHHLMYLSFDLPALAREAGCATAMTLHDFWLQCRLMGQRRDPWGNLCFRLDDIQCGRCLAAAPPESAGRGKRVAAGAMRWLRRLTGIDLGPRAREWARRREARRGGREGRALPAPLGPGPELILAAAAIARRREAVFTRVVPHIACFRSPSRFLARELVAWGLPPERVHHHPLGVEEVEVPRTARGDKVRFAFLGTVAPHKGVTLLVEAFRGLADRASLTLHGGAPYHAAYGEEVARLCAETGARWSGPYGPGDFGRLLGRCDCLVVPSLWFENSPLTILQARRAGIPALVSDLGGMAELVAEGAGWTFPAGDREALAELMARIAAQPELLDFDPADFAPPPTAAEDAAEHLDFYQDLRAGRLP